MDARAALLFALLTAGCSCSEEPAAPEVATSKAEVVVPPGERRVIELADGVRVEILVEGQGAPVGAGTTVLLDYELGYVPNAPAAEPATESAEPAPGSTEPPKDAGSASESTDADPPKASEAVAAEPAAAEPAAPVATEPASAPPADAPVTAAEPAAGEAIVPAPEPFEPLPIDHVVETEGEPILPVTGATPEPADATAAPSTEGTPASAATPPATEFAPVEEPIGTAPPPEPAAAPLERVVIASSKQGVGPVSVRVGADGPLLPALSRALVGLREGTRATIRIPAAAGYSEAARTAAGIPADVALEAEVRIRKVRP